MDRASAFNALTEIEAAALKEASLSRIFAHIKGGEPFVLITAYVNESNKHAIAAGLGPKAEKNAAVIAALPPEEQEGMRQHFLEQLNQRNRQAHESLKTKFDALGLGYIRCVGVYSHKAEHGTSDADVQVREPSLFVIGMADTDLAVRLGKEFWQESVLVGKDGDGVRLRFCDGSPDFRISDHVTPQTFDMGWTEWKTRSFSFQDYQPVKLESVAVVTESFNDNRDYVKAVSEALHRHYGVAQVEMALEAIVNGTPTAEAVARMVKGG